MPSVIGEAFVAIRPDTKGFGSEMRSGLASQSKHEESVRVRPDTGRFGADVQQGVSSQSGALSRAGSDAGETTGRGVGDGLNRGAATGLKKLAVGIGALFVVAAAKGTIDAGSDLNETLSKTTVVFGDLSPAVIKWGENAATSFGLSKQAALESASTFGNLFTSMGIGGLTAGVMSEQIIQLAADLGSFNNVGTDEALESIRSGLVGESEPLRRFGVNINEAAIQAKALEIGLVQGQGATEDITAAQIAAEKAQVTYTKAVKDHGEQSIEARDAAAKQEAAEGKLNEAVAGKVPALNAAQKAQAVYKLILDQTTLAQGDFGRTADGAANQQKILQARVADLRAEIGLQLLPVYQKVLEIGGKIITYLREHQDQAKILAIIIGTVVVAAFAAWAVSAIGAAFATLVAMAPVLIVLAAVGLAIADAIKLWDRFGPSIENAVNDTIIPAINLFIDGINTIIDALNAIPLLGLNISHVGHVGELGGGDGGGAKQQTAGPLGYGQPGTGLYGTGPGGPNPNTGQQTAGPLGMGSPNPYSGVQQILDYLGSLPSYGMGGMVPGALGQKRMIYAHGGEQVLTPEQQRGSGDIHLHYERMPRNGVQIAVEAFQGLRAARQAAAL